MGKIIKYKEWESSVETFLLLSRNPQRGADLPEITQLLARPRVPALSLSP